MRWSRKAWSEHDCSELKNRFGAQWWRHNSVHKACSAINKRVRSNNIALITLHAVKRTHLENLIILLLFVNVNKAYYAYFLIKCWLQPWLWMSDLFTVRSMSDVLVDVHVDLQLHLNLVHAMSCPVDGDARKTSNICACKRRLC